MLIDDARDKNTSLFWLGLDTRLAPGPDGEYEYDGCEAEAVQRAMFNDILDAATVYDCLPLGPMLAQQWGGKPIRFVRDCFGPLPPFPVTALQQKASEFGTGLTFFQSSLVTEPPHVRNYFLKENALKRGGFEGVTVVSFKDEDYTVLTDAKWMVTVSVLIPIPNRAMAFLDNFVGYFCDERGQLLTSPIANEQLNARLQTKPSEAATQAMGKLMEVGLKHFNCGAAVLNLMACKNVSSAVRPIDAKLQKARQRKGKPPLTEYRVLTVTLPGKQRSASDGPTIIANAGEPMPLQTIPGQYRDYRENGLFGKYKGIFWVPAHVRGTAEAGEVRKSYRARAGQVTQGAVINESDTNSA